MTSIQMYSYVLERALLYLMINGGYSNVEAVLTVLDGEETYFYNAQHQNVFNVIKKLYLDGIPVNHITVYEEVKKNIASEKVLKQLFENIGRTYIEDDAASIAIKVKDYFIKRQIYLFTQQLHNDANKSGFDIISALHAHTSNVLRNVISDNDVDTKSIAKTTREIIERAVHYARIGEYYGIPTGFADLDRITGGLKAGQLITLAGRPGMGKTSFGLSLAMNAARKHNVAFFSLEMDKETILMRLVANRTGIQLSKIINGYLTDEELAKVTTALEQIPAQCNIIIDDKEGIDLATLKVKTRHYMQKYGVNMIIVDYLQLMKANKAQTREREIAELSLGVKNIAREYKLPAIIMAQLNREVEHRPNKRPQLSDLRESGCLSADTLILTHKGCKPIKSLCDTEDVTIKCCNITDDGFSDVAQNYKKCFSTGTKKVYKITLHNGSEIKATANHRFYTVNGWKRLDQLSISDYVLLNTQQPIIETDISDNDIVLLAAYMAKYNTKTTYDLPSDFYKAASTIEKLNAWDYILRRYRIIDKLKFIRIPLEFHTMELSKKKKFIETVFEVCGDVGRGLFDEQPSVFIKMEFKDRNVAVCVSSFLLQFGVYAELEQRKINSLVFTLYITDKSSIRNFIETFTISDEKMQEQLNRIYNNIESEHFADPQFATTNSSHFIFVPIKSINDSGYAEVFDIEVPRYHNFIANHFVAHNSIEQDSDIIMLLYRPEYYDIQHYEDGKSTANTCEVIIAKQRNGATGSVRLYYDKETTTFKNLHYDADADF